MTDLEAMGRRLSELDEWLSELERTREFLTCVLRPYWEENARVRNSIARTHDNIDSEDGRVFVVGWRRRDRRPIFDRLDALNSEYAPYKLRLAENGRLMAHTAKAHRRIREAIEREQRRIQNKVQSAQLELL